MGKTTNDDRDHGDDDDDDVHDVEFGDDTLVAGAWTERKKMNHGGSFLKLADDNMDIQNPEAQNRVLSGF